MDRCIVLNNDARDLPCPPPPPLRWETAGGVCHVGGGKESVCGGVETGRVCCEGDEVGEGVGEGGGELEEGYFDRVVADVPCRYKILKGQRRNSFI